jgi:hypothetical protein
MERPRATRGSRTSRRHESEHYLHSAQHGRRGTGYQEEISTSGARAHSVGLKSMAQSDDIRTYKGEHLDDISESGRHGRSSRRRPAGDDAEYPDNMENMVPNYDVESIYGKNFFFQQRRGSLDIRALSQVDLDRIIREVKLDSLLYF